MTKRILKNQHKLNELKTALHQNSGLSDAQMEMNKRSLVALAQTSRPGWQSHPKLWFALAGAAAMAVVGFGLFMYLNWTHPVPLLPPEIAPKKMAVAPPMNAQGLITLLPLYQQVKVPQNNGAKFVMKDQSTIWADAKSELSIESQEGEITLSRGQILAVYAKHKNSVSIRTSHAAVEILGTTFSVTTTPEQLEVRLFEGHIVLHVNGTTETMTAGSYVQVKENQITTRRALDRSDVISALLITERTFHLSGPEVPDLYVASERAEHENSASDEQSSDKKHRTKNRNIKKNKQKTTVPLPVETPDQNQRTQEFVEPPSDDMIVEEATPDASEAESLPEAEQLLEDACSNLRHGDHQKGKEQIRQYLKLHPKDRFWQHVNSIFE